MSLEHYIRKGNRKLRYGYTTGTCAALAAAAATRMLLTAEDVESVSLITPKGIQVSVPVCDKGMNREGGTGTEPVTSAWAGIPKDAGDDSDVTDGMLICARVSRLAEGESVRIDGGEGVGRVTKEGLDQPVGNAAINSGPRKMIEEQVLDVCRQMSYDGGIDVIVYAPEGRQAARQTFNENLGIEGGISILGTTGIVEPMSEQALVDTIELEMKQLALETDCLIMTPGNYGYHYIEDRGLDKLKDEEGRAVPILKFSNFLGDTLDMLPVHGIRKVVLIGHAGKLVKVAGGIMNTHSSYADCRREIICAHLALCGGTEDLCRKVMEATTTDACFDIIDEEGAEEDLLGRVISSMLEAIQHQLDHRVKGEVEIGAVLFSNVRGRLGATSRAREILNAWGAGDRY